MSIFIVYTKIGEREREREREGGGERERERERAFLVGGWFHMNSGICEIMG